MSWSADEYVALADALELTGRSVGDLELIGGICNHFDGLSGVPDLGVALAAIPAKVDAGYRSICLRPSMFTDDVGEVGAICRRVVEALERAC